MNLMIILKEGFKMTQPPKTKTIRFKGTTYIVSRKFVGKKSLKQIIERLIKQDKT